MNNAEKQHNQNIDVIVGEMTGFIVFHVERKTNR